MLIDTAGFDDDEEILGAERIQRTATASEKVELAIILISYSLGLIIKQLS